MTAVQQAYTAKALYKATAAYVVTHPKPAAHGSSDLLRKLGYASADMPVASA